MNAQRRFAEAERYAREAQENIARSLGTEHWRHAGAGRTLGVSLAGQRRFAEAETVLLASYEALRTSRGDANRTTRLALARVVELYEAWGRRETAATYRERLGAGP